MNWVCRLLCVPFLICLGVVVSVARADHTLEHTSLQFLQNSSGISEDFREAMRKSLDAVADGDITTAMTEALNANQSLVDHITLTDDAVNDGVVDAKARDKVVKNFQKALTNLQVYIDIIQNSIDNGLPTKTQIVAASSKAIGDESKVVASIQSFKKKEITRMTLVSSKVDINAPSALTCWKISGLPKNYKTRDDCPLTVKAVNPTALGIEALLPDGQQTPFIGNPCTGKFCFMMGEDMGGGRIEVTDSETNETASRIVFNRGSGRPNVNGMPTMAQLSGLAQFAGTYTGPYSGSADASSEKCFELGVIGFSGTVTLTVSNSGIITVSAPNPGSGKLSATGAAATGAVFDAEWGVPVYFKAGVTNVRDNSSATMKGSWSGKHSCGAVGVGTWTATRSGPPPP
jgi:hypothetical protein